MSSTRASFVMVLDRDICTSRGIEGSIGVSGDVNRGGDGGDGWDVKWFGMILGDFAVLGRDGVILRVILSVI